MGVTRRARQSAKYITKSSSMKKINEAIAYERGVLATLGKMSRQGVAPGMVSYGREKANHEIKRLKGLLKIKDIKRLKR